MSGAARWCWKARGAVGPRPEPTPVCRVGSGEWLDGSVSADSEQGKLYPKERRGVIDGIRDVVRSVKRLPEVALGALTEGVEIDRCGKGIEVYVAQAKLLGVDNHAFHLPFRVVTRALEHSARGLATDSDLKAPELQLSLTAESCSAPQSA